MLLLSTVGQIFLCELDLKALGHFSEAAVQPPRTPSCFN